MDIRTFRVRGLRKVARHIASPGRARNSSMLSSTWAANSAEIKSKNYASPWATRGCPLSLAAPFSWPPDSRGVPLSWGFSLARPGVGFPWPVLAFSSLRYNGAEDRLLSIWDRMPREGVGQIKKKTMCRYHRHHGFPSPFPIAYGEIFSESLK